MGNRSTSNFDYKYKRVDNGNMETAQNGVEYYCPDQHGGICGVVYRQYFNTSLPTNLTTGSRVSNLIDWNVMYSSSGVRNAAHGYTTAYGAGDSRISIYLSGITGNGNLAFANNSYVPIKGWVDYTK